ncbi:HNH endonuclease [Sphingomonas sp. LaA6.9]|uniref:HNH endonuclease n=1 Tax=Sphingomonas sp. LaA6.9 TaxID=2919914 RepID=UPI001F503F2F|nr:HNH endonuclease [Sphingomonas sp. LaA6.9]MCJ8158821.1 HNH endonuclease [Sphingomonas sp. LaA6.9]
MKGRPIPYSDAELAWIEARHLLPRAELHSTFCTTFGRDDVTVDSIKQLCLRRGWKTGRTGCFAPGIPPANKGKKMPYNPNSARTQFKKGNLPHNTRWLGHERVSKDGYVEISIAETNPHTGFGRRYVLKHKWLWELANGPLAEKLALKCLDGNKQNTDPENWEPVPRAMLPRLNGRFGRDYESAAPEIKPTIMAIAKLEHRARTAKRKSS